MFALQSEIKSLQKKLKECTENEQRALAEYRTLQEAIKDKKELEATLQKKEAHITALETEVTFIVQFFYSILYSLSFFSGNDPLYKLRDLGPLANR